MYLNPTVLAIAITVLAYTDTVAGFWLRFTMTIPVQFVAPEAAARIILFAPF